MSEFMVAYPDYSGGVSMKLLLEHSCSEMLSDLLWLGRYGKPLALWEGWLTPIPPDTSSMRSCAISTTTPSRSVTMRRYATTAHANRSPMFQDLEFEADSETEGCLSFHQKPIENQSPLGRGNCSGSNVYLYS